MHHLAVFELLLMAAAAVYFTCFSNAAASRTAFWCWFVSGRLALMFLAFSFDYLPHRPHTSTRAQNPIKATSVTSLFTHTDSWLLTLPLLHQNYHNIHHLFPYIPFYRYSQAWAALSPSLLDMGTQIAPVFSLRPHPLLQQRGRRGGKRCMH
jgi:fatty acid desaturase